jgi:hypothetical protein
VPEWSANPLAGIGEDFELRVKIAEHLVLINHLARSSQNPELLKWVRNKVGEPYAVITKRLGAEESLAME